MSSTSGRRTSRKSAPTVGTDPQAGTASDFRPLTPEERRKLVEKPFPPAGSSISVIRSGARHGGVEMLSTITENGSLEETVASIAATRARRENYGRKPSLTYYDNH